MAAGVISPQPTNMDIHESPDPEQLAQDLAAYLSGRINQLIAERGVCHLALAGGNSPRRVYELLRTQPIDWSHVHFWFGDERCLPCGDPERNDTMAQSALLSHLTIQKAQVHNISSEKGPVDAASRYTQELSKIERIDIALLGMGEDGHTASLFPGNTALTLNNLAVPVFDAPKAPAERVSMGLPTLQQAGERLILAAGSGKQPILQAISDGKSFPVTRIGEAKWFLDTAALAARSENNS